MPSKALRPFAQTSFQFLAHSTLRHRARAASLRFERLAALHSREQFRERDPKRVGNSYEGGQAEILPPRFQVAQEGAMHLAVIGERFLRGKAPLDADLANALPESFQDIVHAQSVCEWLPNRLQIVR